MDKYQKAAINWQTNFYIMYVSVKSQKVMEAIFDEKEDTATINQEEDITSCKYNLVIFDFPAIYKCYAYKNEKWSEITKTEFKRFQSYQIETDFKDRIEKIKLCFMHNIADDYIIDLKYKEADAKAYHEKLMVEAKEKLLKNASVKHSTGLDLVNIYFQPCSQEYDRTEISLYINDQIIAKYNVDAEIFFKSINGLAFGVYEYIVTQYDKNNKILIRTDKIMFKISGGNTDRRRGRKGLVAF